MELTKDIVFDALTESIKHLLPEDEGVVVMLNDNKLIIANLNSQPSAIPIEEILIEDQQDIDAGQRVKLKPAENE